MKTLHTLSSLFLIGSLLTLPASADHGSNIKCKARVELSVTLVATAAAPVGAAGTADIRIRSKNDVQNARLKLAVSGLLAGGYTVNATLADATTVNLGAFDVAAPSPLTNNNGDDDDGLSFIIPDTVDALKIASIDVKDASAVVVLQGDTTADIAFLRYFANVRVTGPVVTTSRHDGAKKVHGHALAHSITTHNVERERHFLWVAFGAPADTVLTINVDGVAVGTVTSTKQGKVKFKSLPDIDFASMKLITLTDPLNAVVMQAQF